MAARAVTLPDEAMRHGEAPAPAMPGAPLAALGNQLRSTGFVWFLADLAHLPDDLCASTARETAWADSGRTAMDRPGWLARRRLARQVVATARDTDPAAVTIEADGMGRPILGGAGKGLHLSFAARHALALIGIAGAPLGVDLEIEEPGMALPWNILRPEESAWLEAQPDPLRLPAFLRIWTAKEAIVKLVGQGFRIAPERIRLPRPGAVDVDIRNLSGGERANPDNPGFDGITVLTCEALPVFVSQATGEGWGRPLGVSVAVARFMNPKAITGSG